MNITLKQLDNKIACLVKSLIKYLFFTLLAVFYSCSGSQETRIIISKIPVKEIKAKINHNFELIESLSASGSVAFDSPQMSNSGSIEVRLRKPDTVFVKVEGPFGIDIAEALITRTNFVYYNAQENKAITGPTTQNNIDAILKVSVNFDELINSLSGSFYFNKDVNDSIDAASEDNSYVLKVNGDNLDSKYLISPEMYVINKYGVFDKHDHSVFEVTYSKFNTEMVSNDTLYFPSQILISCPDKKQKLWLNYDDKEFNKKKLNFKIRIPNSARIIKWDS